MSFQKRFEITEVVQMTVESNSGVPPFINFVEGAAQRGVVKRIQLSGHPSEIRRMIVVLVLVDVVDLPKYIGARIVYESFRN